jgi:hypothetical protein
MYEDTEKFVDIDFEQSVRKAAYHLWEDDGRPHGREKEYWFKALEQLLAQRDSSAAGNSKNEPQH